MKKLFKKKQIILAALVFLLATAIYINWQFNSNVTDNAPQSQSDDNLGDAEFVGTNNVKIEKEENEYFASARKEREETRNELLEELEEIQKDVKLSDEAINSAVKKHVEVLGYSETERNIESLVKAKGFKDCIAIIGEDSVNVIVLTDNLENADVLQIQDIVLSQKKIDLDSIKIINVE